MIGPSPPGIHARALGGASARAPGVPSPSPWSWSRIWTVFLGATTAIAVLDATHVYLGLHLAGEVRQGFEDPITATWAHVFRGTLLSWTWLGVIAPGAVWLARRFPLAPNAPARHFGIHLLAALLFASLFQLGASLLGFSIFVPRAGGAVTLWSAFLGYFAVYFNLFFVFYWSIVGVHSTLRYYREAQVRSVETTKLEAVATKARLEALRRQLHPHFLFNLLSGISSLVLEGDRRSAVEALSDLSQLLRVSFAREDPFIPLREELRFLDLYVDLHRLRLEDRVRIQYRIDPAAEEASVPTFLLQPLVENAIEHGVGRRSHGGAVTVTARATARTLEITVSNPVPVPRGPARATTGVGLANTRERIARSYGGRGTFDFEIGAEEAVARVVVPLGAVAWEDTRWNDESER